MLTTKHSAKPRKAATAHKRVKPSSKDLQFVSANQQLEGFSGEISKAVAGHEPDMEEIARSAKRFGAQIPSEENRKRRRIFSE